MSSIFFGKKGTRDAMMLRALRRRLAPNVISWAPTAKALPGLDAAKAVSASLVRGCLEEAYKSEAAPREKVQFAISKWSAGKPDKPKIPWTAHSTNIRRIHTEAESTSTLSDKLQPRENSKSSSESVEMPSIIHEENTVQHKAISNLKTSTRHDLALVFTCKVCETRSVRTVCRESYDKGVVVVRCGGCNNLHLIADRLGWFGEPGSVEDLLAARGEEVKKGSVDTLNLTVEDLAGTKLS